MTSNPTLPTRIVTHALVGFGPRNATLLKHAVVSFLSERALFHKMGHEVAFYIFDEASEDEFAQGKAWSTFSDGNANSGIPVSAPLRGVEKIQEDWLQILQRAINFEVPASDDIRTNFRALEDHYRRINPAAYALLRESMLPNGVDTTAPWGTRSSIGTLLQKSVLDVIEFVRNNVPQIQIYINLQTRIMGIDVSDPGRPVIAVGPHPQDRMPFDFVHLGQGIVKSLHVNRHWIIHDYWSQVVCVDPANYENLLARLRAGDLLEPAGTIRPETNIAIAGLGLSAYDYVPILMQFTDILQVTGDGWRINETNARKYQGLLTFIAPDERVAPPCHYRDPGQPANNDWPRETSLISTEELHALKLQKHFNWMAVAMPLLRANVCLEMGKPLDLIDPAARRTALQQMRDYHEQNEMYRDGHQTEIGLLRTGQQLFFEGHGLERYPGQASNALRAKAPLTRVSGPMARKSLLSEMSLPNVAFMNRSGNLTEWKYLKMLDSASPVHVQDLVAQLFLLGVATYQTGKMENMSVARDGRRVSLSGGSIGYDLVISPPTDRRAAWFYNLDRYLPNRNDILRMDRESEESGPEVTKGRHWKSGRDGAGLNVIDGGNTIAGHLMSTDAIQDGWLLAAHDSDYDTLTGIFDWAPTASKNLVLLSALVAGGFRMPYLYVNQAFRRTFPPGANDFDAETAQFQDAWEEVISKYAFVEHCDHLRERIPPTFLQSVFDPAQRQVAVEEINRLIPGSRSYYDECIARIGPFRPLNEIEYNDYHHIDYTPDQMDQMWADLISHFEARYQRLVGAAAPAS